MIISKLSTKFFNISMKEYDKDNNRLQINASNQEIIQEKIIKSTGEIQIIKYLKGRLLGKGGFAECYEFTCLDSKKVYASKIISKISLMKSRMKKKLISEIKIHKSLAHPNIVKFEHYFEDIENVYILLEMCQNQSLNDLLIRRKKLTEIEVQCYLIQIIEALKYLHSHRVIHRDLKLGNLFLTDKMELKIGDFGLATMLEFEGERKRTICGTPNYIAPEIIQGLEGYSFEVDIWSFGVVFYTLLIGKPPFETNGIKTTYKKIKMNDYNFPNEAVISNAAKCLIKEILVLNPFNRPSLDNILTHEFFNLGIDIPKLLPISTLSCPPTLSYIKKYMPEADINGIVFKKITYKSKNYLIDNMIDYNKNEKELINQMHYKNHDLGIIEETIKRPIQVNHDSIMKETQENMNGINKHCENDLKIKICPENNDNYKNDQLIHDSYMTPNIRVKKWVDFSTKYGLGYILSNNTTGVYFNDSSKILLDNLNGVFYYIDKRDSDKKEFIKTHYLNDYPKELSKKVTLLNHFKDYLDRNNFKSQQFESPVKSTQEELKKNDKSTKNEPCIDNLVYVKKWFKTKNCMMFRLNNKIIQVCFQDNTEIILSSDTRIVIYINKKKEKLSLPLQIALKSDNLEMTKRLKYTKEILSFLLNLNSNKENINHEDNNI